MKAFMIVMLLFSFIVSAQEDSCLVNSPGYKTQYTKLLDLYEKMHDSETNKQYEALVSEIFKKARYDSSHTDGELISMVNLKDWICDNIIKTEYRNCNESLADYDKLMEAYQKRGRENLELYKYLGEVAKGDCGPKLLLAVFKELNLRYGHRFSK